MLAAYVFKHGAVANCFLGTFPGRDPIDPDVWDRARDAAECLALDEAILIMHADVEPPTGADGIDALAPGRTWGNQNTQLFAENRAKVKSRHRSSGGAIEPGPVIHKNARCRVSKFRNRSSACAVGRAATVPIQSIAGIKRLLPGESSRSDLLLNNAALRLAERPPGLSRLL